MSNYYDSTDVADLVSESLTDPYDSDTLETCYYCGEKVDFDADDLAVLRNRRVYCSLLCATEGNK